MPRHLSDCDDTEVMLHALQNMPPVIDIKAAGTAMRFLTAFLSVTQGEHVITGTDRMKHRPIGILVDALRYLGADITYEGEEGYPPLRVKGKGGWGTGNCWQCELAVYLGSADDRPRVEERAGTAYDRWHCLATLYRPYAVDDARVWGRCRLDRC